jgi:hypothetical protein
MQRNVASTTSVRMLHVQTTRRAYLQDAPNGPADEVVRPPSLGPHLTTLPAATYSRRDGIVHWRSASHRTR